MTSVLVDPSPELLGRPPRVAILDIHRCSSTGGAKIATKSSYKWFSCRRPACLGSTRIPSPFVVVHNVKGKASAVDHLPEIGPTMVEYGGIWWNTECSKSHRNDALQRWGNTLIPPQKPPLHTHTSCCTSGLFFRVLSSPDNFKHGGPPPPWALRELLLWSFNCHVWCLQPLHCETYTLTSVPIHFSLPSHGPKFV